MEIYPFLPDGSRRKNERPERRVERCPDLGKPGFLVAALRAAEPQSVPAGESDALVFEVIDVGSSVHRLPQGDGAPRG